MSSFRSISAEALVIRDRSSNQKGKGNRGRSKSIPGFKDIKKNQFTFCKELGHWKIDCPRIKDKKKESTEANLEQVISTQAGTSRQVDRTQTHQYSRSSLLLLLLVTQVILSEY